MKKNVDIDWLMQKENFMYVYANKGIESENIEIVYEAIVRPMDDMDKYKEASEEMRKTLELCPTLNEVKEAIRYSKKGKAGGPTGLTYNMLKLASEDIIIDIYNEIVKQWENELEIADFW
jgi:hypothetical protein